MFRSFLLAAYVTTVSGWALLSMTSSFMDCGGNVTRSWVDAAGNNVGKHQSDGETPEHIGFVVHNDRSTATSVMGETVTTDCGMGVAVHPSEGKRVAIDSLEFNIVHSLPDNATAIFEVEWGHNGGMDNAGNFSTVVTGDSPMTLQVPEADQQWSECGVEYAPTSKKYNKLLLWTVLQMNVTTTSGVSESTIGVPFVRLNLAWENCSEVIPM